MDMIMVIPWDLKEGVTDYMYYLRSSKNILDYDKTTKFLLNHIHKTYQKGKDITNALDNLTDTDLAVLKPQFKWSMLTNADKKDAENEEFKIDYKMDYDAWKKWVEVYRDNKEKMHTFL